MTDQPLPHLKTVDDLDAYLASKKRARTRYPFKAMEVGHMFEVDMRDAAGVRSGMRNAQAKMPGRKFVSHREGDKLVVVRIA